MSTITVADGKYTVINGNGAITALRYGQPWRDCAGDGLMLALVHEIERLREDRPWAKELARASADLHRLADEFSAGGLDFNDIPENRNALARVDEALSMLDHLLED